MSLKEEQVDGCIATAAKWLVDRENTKKIVAWILGIFVLALFVAFAVGALASTAFAADPAIAAAALDFNPARAWLGLADPFWLHVGNMVWWTVEILVLGGVLLYLFSRHKVRDWLAAQEYNEAIGLRRQFVPDGGEIKGKAEQMGVGSAIYIVGIVALEKLFVLGVLWLTVRAITRF